MPDSDFEALKDLATGVPDAPPQKAHWRDFITPIDFKAIFGGVALAAVILACLTVWIVVVVYGVLAAQAAV